MRCLGWVLKSSAMVLAVTLGIGPVQSEPGPTVTYLLNENASLFDFGMLQLSEHLRLLGEKIQSKNPKFSDLHVIALYNWDDNRINITAIIVDIKDKIIGVDDCRAILREIRDDAGYDTSNSKLSGFAETVFGSTSYSSYFHHSDYQRTSEPKNLNQELDKIFRVEVELGKIKCNGPLVGSDVFVAQ